ncbi:MAG: hypothetical protein COX55_03565 [Zetaproteobacteria bacterium CG23_combo_of_CG06-09_8_20_14_all_54_7]|nr:MAG: hypothetical protein COX55_03565 [Zetaproteobacteria bacterium CG23_combo_of_CG06-09_8_20_14_all_54_7]
MTNEDIHQRMLKWAEWVLRSDGGGLGFPCECSYTRMQQRSDCGFTAPEVDIESAETEKAVQSLEQYLRHAVQAHYCMGGTRESQARQLGCSTTTVERRVERAHGQIARYLEEAKRVRR